jgi:hypothetical protein
MDFNAVYHRANDNYCYPINENELIINLKTGYDVKYVNIIHGDPFTTGILGGNEAWSGAVSTNIPFKKRLKDQLWWTTTIKPPFKRLKYYFELITEEEKWYFFEDGFLSEKQLNIEGRSKQFFVMPWMNSSDICTTPSWVNDTVWYQIFPERFCNGNKENDPEYVKAWREEGSVSNQEFFGGDLDGIIQKLDYLEKLGISGL